MAIQASTMPMFEFKRTVDIGNLLTAAMIALSALGLLHSFSKDRDVQIRDQANQIRVSASDIIYRVDRLSSLPLLSIARLQRTFVETSEIMNQNGNWQPLEARDFLWKQISEEQTHIEEAIYTANLNVLAGHFFAYDPGIRQQYNIAASDLQTTRKQFFHDLLDETQADVMYFIDKQSGYQTALLGNRLRMSAERLRQQYAEDSGVAVAAIVNDMIETVELTDTALIDRFAVQ